ncbi:hypothetical protein DPMN_094095 [Dreissena polymorpha]|uniref:Uncharacterized protein n=1 Tax=Dreissena polymorpha TaxID=45954 RepID=A0A9D4L5G6_DREPO|nr:hypothetical protein DPMN_094095 [Dreissena polymorpha]
MNCIDETDCYVLDGGTLLNRLPWAKCETNNVIAESYADFTDKQQWCSMVTKTVLLSKISQTRDENKNVNVHLRMCFNKEQKIRPFFLDKNKAGMIALISTALTKRGYYVLVSRGDADVNIVKATVK